MPSPGKAPLRPPVEFWLRINTSQPANLTELGERLAQVGRTTHWEHGVAGFVGDDYTFCVYYNRKAGRFRTAWYYFKQCLRTLVRRRA